MIHMPEEPLWPHLIEIARRRESQRAVLAGGLGLRLKKAHLTYVNAKTVFTELVELRPTVDIDLFLRIDLWIDRDVAKDFRAMLDDLGYKPVVPNWRFEKPLANVNGKTAKLDLMARQPTEGEDVKVSLPRVGTGQKIGIHGHLAEEAFAIDTETLTVTLATEDTTVNIQVAHPYAYLNLKVAAANDWVRELREEIKPRFVLNADGSSTEARVREKHVTDVYAIVGMMTAEELSQAEDIARNYADHPKAKEIRDAAKDLYGSKESIGSQAVSTYNNGAWADHFDGNYGKFWDALSQALGIS